MEPNVAEFVSALAAGSGARLMVEARSNAVGPTTLALIAAAEETGGHVICILNNPDDLSPSLKSVGDRNPGLIQLIVGDAFELISKEYKAADFVLVDCALRDQERVFRAAQVSALEASGGLVVGLNAFDCEKFKGSGRLRVDLLPIGGGLRVCRVPKRERLRSRWVVRVDEFTGEEHVYRITPPVQRKMIRA